METLFQNKYRIKSNRRPFWDYSRFGWYFITVCTQHKEHYFGEIVDGEIQLNEMGKIVNDELLKTTQIRKNVQLDEFIVMPNHVHVIIIITHKYNADPNVETRCSVSLPKGGEFSKPISGSLSMTINYFKGSVKRIANQNNISFQWQSNYYDHIIRNDDDLKRIQQYIDENPQNWDRDRNNPEGLMM